MCFTKYVMYTYMSQLPISEYYYLRKDSVYSVQNIHEYKRLRLLFVKCGTQNLKDFDIISW